MIKLIIVAACTIASAVGQAQKNIKAEAEIRKLEKLLETALVNKDSNTLKKYWAPEFLVNTPRNDIAQSRDSVLMLQTQGFINYSSFEKVIERMQFQKNLVITMGHETYEPRNPMPGNAVARVFKRRFTNVWMKKNGNWQQIARHASMICQ